MSILTEEFGKIIAFYSFKGGTGRCMALANVGCVLAQQKDTPSQVLMVDWDLEASGLHRYFRKHLYGAFRGTAPARWPRARAFEPSGLWERLSALDQKEFMKLPPRERLACGYYEAARRRAAQLKEVA